MRTLLYLMVFLSFIGASHAQTLTPEQTAPRPHLMDEDHWYPVDCCGFNDCEPIPPGGVHATETGWMVDYVSKKPHIGHIKEHVDFSFPRAEASKDGQFHGCWHSRLGHRRSEGGFGPSEQNDPRYNPNKRVICFYYPEPGV